MRKKSSQKDWPSFPEPYKGLQVNCCKFTKCENFGIAPEYAIHRALSDENFNDNTQERQVTKHHPLYGTSGSGKNEAALVCNACKNRIANGELVQVTYCWNT